MNAPAIISEFDDAQAIEKVFWLDISMDNVLRVNILERLADLVNVPCGFFLGVVLIGLFLQVLVELALRTVLQDHINLVIIVEEAIELHDVLVVQVAVNFDFPAQLVSHVRL